MLLLLLLLLLLLKTARKTFAPAGLMLDVSAAELLTGLLKHSVVVWLLRVRLNWRTAPRPVAQPSDGLTPAVVGAVRR
jgi:hypothetical protein